MKNGIWVIGDVHGMYGKLVRLLDKLPKDSKICFTGDLIDRGEDSAKVVELVRQKGYPCVLGNHESMMMKSHNDDIQKEMWKQCGGQEALESYAAFDSQMFEAHIEYFKTLPYFLYFKMEGHKPLVVSHSYIHHLWINEDHKYSLNDADDILWRRMHDKNLFDGERELKNGFFNIFGHSVVYNPVVTDTYAMIDTGAYYENNKHLGYLSTIHYPSLEVIQVF